MSRKVQVTFEMEIEVDDRADMSNDELIEYLKDKIDVLLVDDYNVDIVNQAWSVGY